MEIEEAADMVRNIVAGFPEMVISCMDADRELIVRYIHEQLYSGIDGDGNDLHPTYDNDPYFQQEGEWYHRAADYKAWKMNITPPQASLILGLPPRPDNVPNLYINGTFYSDITATRQGMELVIDPGTGNGPDILSKYGSAILEMCDEAVASFNTNILDPEIDLYLERCGYRQ